MAYGGYMNRGDRYHGKTYVYYALDRNSDALYIGMTTCVNTRLKQHKYRDWFNDVESVGYINCKTRELAKSIERFLIRLHQPVFNSQGK